MSNEHPRPSTSSNEDRVAQWGKAWVRLRLRQHYCRRTLTSGPTACAHVMSPPARESRSRDARCNAAVVGALGYDLAVARRDEYVVGFPTVRAAVVYCSAALRPLRALPACVFPPFRANVKHPSRGFDPQDLSSGTGRTRPKLVPLPTTPSLDSSATSRHCLRDLTGHARNEVAAWRFATAYVVQRICRRSHSATSSFSSGADKSLLPLQLGRLDRASPDGRNNAQEITDTSPGESDLALAAPCRPAAETIMHWAICHLTAMQSYYVRYWDRCGVLLQEVCAASGCGHGTPKNQVILLPPWNDSVLSSSHLSVAPARLCCWIP